MEIMADAPNPNIYGRLKHIPVYFSQDIYKFNPDDYMARYLNNRNPIKKMILRKGLEFVDKRFTPIIVKGKKYTIIR